VKVVSMLTMICSCFDFQFCFTKITNKENVKVVSMLTMLCSSMTMLLGSSIQGCKAELEEQRLPRAAFFLSMQT
jgi:hypothetical protein